MRISYFMLKLLVPDLEQKQTDRHQGNIACITQKQDTKIPIYAENTGLLGGGIKTRVYSDGHLWDFCCINQYL